MPTPFTHLLAANALLHMQALPWVARQALAAHLPAFLLGNIAPDVQTVSGQTREATHFFTIPFGDAPPAQVVLFQHHALLARAENLPPAHAAFIAGYLAHLVFDQLWITEILNPAFGPAQTWATFRERLYFHNALRAYVDAADLAQISAPTGEALALAQPEAWLPFVTDAHLIQWRDWVAHQLLPGATSRTVEVFAGRMNADPEAFAALVNSPEAMQAHVFAHLSLDDLDRYRTLALAQSAELLAAYWEGQL
jgi:hypothetical protein